MGLWVKTLAPKCARKLLVADVSFPKYGNNRFWQVCPINLYMNVYVCLYTCEQTTTYIYIDMSLYLLYGNTNPITAVNTLKSKSWFVVSVCFPSIHLKFAELVKETFGRDLQTQCMHHAKISHDTPGWWQQRCSRSWAQNCGMSTQCSPIFGCFPMFSNLRQLGPCCLRSLLLVKSPCMLVQATFIS